MFDVQFVFLATRTNNQEFVRLKTCGERV